MFDGDRPISGASSTGLIDTVTGLAGEEGLEVLTNYAIARARREGDPVSLVILELAVAPLGSLPGSAAGDAALGEFGRLLRSTLRASDVVARREATSFVLVLAQTESFQVPIVCHHLDAVLRDHNVTAPGPPSYLVTAGWATFEPGGLAVAYEELLAEAATMVRSPDGVMLGAPEI